MYRYGIVLSGVIIFIGCGISKEKYTSLEGQMKTCQNQLTTVTEEKNSCEANLDTVSVKKTELEKKTKTYEDLVSSLKDEISAGKIKISRMQDRLTVNLIDKILFKSGSTRIQEEGKVALQKIASVLKGIEDKRIQVEGHTDNVKLSQLLQRKFPTNWELSTARATAVVRYLASLEVPQEKLSATGYSMFAPVSENETEDGRGQNRRIEIVLLPIRSRK